jgi:hypothetical protein
LNKTPEVCVAIRCVKDRISRTELKVLSGDEPVATIKVVADIEKRIIAFGGLMHRDIEVSLLSNGSHLKDLWGFSLYLDRPWSEAFEFRSHVNVRPQDGSPSIQIHDEKLRQGLIALAAERIDWDR